MLFNETYNTATIDDTKQPICRIVNEDSYSSIEFARVAPNVIRVKCEPHIMPSPNAPYFTTPGPYLFYITEAEFQELRKSGEEKQ